MSKNIISVLMYHRHKFLDQNQHVNFVALNSEIPVLISDNFVISLRYFQYGGLKEDVTASSKLQNL
jgi:hypothetical protein